MRRKTNRPGIASSELFAYLHVVVIFRVSQPCRGKPQARAILDDGTAGYQGIKINALTIVDPEL